MKRVHVYLQDSGVLRSPRLVNAFEAVERKDFLPLGQRRHVDEDRPLPIGHGQTNSQPSTVAFMLEKLQPKPGDRVLDVGSGSGWTTALLAHAVGSDGRVYGVERVPELVKFGRENLTDYDFENAEIVEANDTLGLPDEAPFDRILVSAAAEELPDKLVDQLANGGRMIIAVKHSLMQVDKSLDGDVEVREYPGFAFVPLWRG